LIQDWYIVMVDKAYIRWVFFLYRRWVEDHRYANKKMGR